MTRFVLHPQPIEQAYMSLQLTITGARGNYDGTYSQKSMILRATSTSIAIKIANKTEDNASVKIVNYASTGVTESHHPIHCFRVEHDGQSATFMLDLLEHQSIDFGVFVEIKTEGKAEPTIIFCDPQASHDPLI
jgi:hypothetical protein